MISDNNKGISSISYNHLNLPTSVSFPSQQSSISYVYDATGVKQKKVVTGMSIGTTTTEYAGNYIYENNILQFFSHGEGYVKHESTKFGYVYQYKDHLGNVRITYSDDSGNGKIEIAANTGGNYTEIVEESNYYPFGLKHKGYNNVTSSNGNSLAQRKTFNGKELQDELDLNWHDFGARNYDASLGRWMNIDPLAEKYYGISTYAYGINNPIFFIDPDGREVEGYDRRSARRARRIIRRTFRRNRKLKKLFNLNGNKFEKISQADFDAATQDSDSDELALAKGYFDAINSSNVHKVEVVRRGEKVKSSFKYGYGKGKDVDKDAGGGVNSPTFNLNGEVNGSESIIVMNTRERVKLVDNRTGKIVNVRNDSGDLLAHELLGHGLTDSQPLQSVLGGALNSQHHLTAVQVSNLYLRHKNGGARFYDNGVEHGGNPRMMGKIPLPIPGSLSWQIPGYLK